MGVGGHGGNNRAADELGNAAKSTMLTELLAFLDELLSYLESVRDVRGEDGRSARRSPEIERLTQKTRALRNAVSPDCQKD
jgi:hypothetical protein